MSWTPRAKTKNPKIQEMADQVLDILQIALRPFHEDALHNQCFDAMKLKNIDYIVGLLKDTAGLIDDETNQYANLSTDELLAKIKSLSS